MKVLVLTQLFPNKERPIFGIFIKERMFAVAKLCNLKVVAPVPWFPPLKVFKKWYTFSQVPREEVQQGTKVFHPRFFITPKLMRSLYGMFYFLSILPYILFKIRPKFDFDVIDVHWVYPDGFAGVLLGKLLKKPVIVSARGTDISLYSKIPLIKEQIIYTLRNAQKVIAVCQALKDRMCKLGIPESKITVVPNGIDIQKFSPLPKIEARKLLNLPLDKKIVLSVGYLIERKGFHHLIDAIYKLKKETNQDILLVIVGEGDSRITLQKQIEKLSLGSYVKLVGAKLHSELYKWYSAADLFCLASSREGWPNVLFEAIACGIPVVATNIWGNPEVICSDEYGILVPGQDGNSLADGIHEALKKEWNTMKLVEYARKNTWDKIAQKVMDEFKYVITPQSVDDNQK